MRKSLFLLAAVAAVLMLPSLAQAAPACSSATISGPSNVYAENMCVNPTWSTACTCPFNYVPFFIWSVDDVYSGGSSASATFCPTTPAQTDTITVWVEIYCGRFIYFPPSKSVFVSQCDNTTSPPTCLG